MTTIFPRMGEFQCTCLVKQNLLRQYEHNVHGRRLISIIARSGWLCFEPVPTIASPIRHNIPQPARVHHVMPRVPQPGPIHHGVDGNNLSTVVKLGQPVRIDESDSSVWDTTRLKVPFDLWPPFVSVAAGEGGVYLVVSSERILELKVFRIGKDGLEEATIIIIIISFQGKALYCIPLREEKRRRRRKVISPHPLRAF